MTRLEGRRVLVVGAGTADRGDPEAPVRNGRAIAVRCGREGAHVVCADIDEASAAATAALVEAEGATAEVVVVDVSDEAACEAVVAASGELHGLVLNVGIGLGSGLKRTTAADWDTTFAVNLRGHFLVTKAALPDMAEGGSIVFIASGAALGPGSRLPAYDASKAGILGLNRHVAMEAARRGVRSNVVCLGLIDTPMGRTASAGRPSRDKTPVPLGRQGSGWEVAAAVAFLLSDDASYITGDILQVDGGLHLI